MASSTVNTGTSSGSVSFSGLGSGIDTKSIVEQLLQVDSKYKNRLEKEQTALNTKIDTYTTLKTDITTLQDAVEDLRSSKSYNVYSASSSDEDALVVSATTSAREGNYSVKILQLAQAEALSTDSYASTDTALGVSGEILINGKALTIRSSDTLTDIKNAINSLDQGVSATILTVSDSDNRLILTAESQGENGFRIANAGANDALGALGLTDGATSIRETSDGKVYSADFDSAAATIGSMTGISGDSGGTISIRGESLSINLSTDTLVSIRDKINALGLAGVTAAVETETVSGNTVYSLSISGTRDFTDDGNVLETIGILKGGTSGVKSQYQTSDLSLLASGDFGESALLANLGAKSGETITISGTDADGNTVSNSLKISSSTKVSDLLSTIENAFSGNVTARLEDGKITIENNKSGETSFAVNLTANNEKGGTLDFGTLSNTQVGRERLVTEGRDAKLLVNNITVSRSSNVISNALTGLSLTLKEADADTTLNITVKRDTDAIKDTLKKFVDAYNAVVDFVDDNSEYDKDTNTTGTLMGDSTVTSMLSQIRSVLRQSVSGKNYSYTQLVQIGIETTSDGHAKIDSEALNEALKDDVDGISDLLSADRSSTNNDISFVYNSTKTKAGTYSVQITQAAEKATFSSEILSETASGKLTLTDNYGSELAVEYRAGDSAADIANAVNAEASKKYVQIVRSDAALKTSDGDAVSQNTSLADIEGITIAEGDSIIISGSSHSGSSFQRRIVLNQSENTSVQDVLTAIEEAADSNITASLDAEGHIQVQDKTEGVSKLSISISSTVSGLSLGPLSIVQKGRNAVTVDASVTADNRLSVSHSSYGSSNTFTVSGGNALGIADGQYQGKDVAGTINGVAGEGNGQSLTASSSDASSRGIVVSVKLRTEDLTDSSKATSKITLVSGVADSLYRTLSSFTDTVNGLLQTKLDSFDRSMDTLTDNISDAEERLEQRKEMYTKKYSQLEKTLSLLDSLQSQLSSSLSALS